MGRQKSASELGFINHLTFTALQALVLAFTYFSFEDVRSSLNDASYCFPLSRKELFLKQKTKD